MWNFGPRRPVPELLVAEAKAHSDSPEDPTPEAKAVATCAAQHRQWAQRIDGHRVRQPVTVSAGALAEATALREK